MKGRGPIPVDQAARVAAWEASFGQDFPGEYRSFLTRYDGGFPYPLFFDEATPDAFRRFPDPRAICDRLFSLDEAQAHTGTGMFGGGTPPGFVVFGEDPAGLSLLLSMRSQDLGGIFLWQATTLPWGSDGNDEGRLFKQADSFVAFLDSLYETDDLEGYEHWATRLVVANAVELDLG